MIDYLQRRKAKKNVYWNKTISSFIVLPLKNNKDKYPSKSRFEVQSYQGKSTPSGREMSFVCCSYFISLKNRECNQEKKSQCPIFFFLILWEFSTDDSRMRLVSVFFLLSFCVKVKERRQQQQHQLCVGRETIGRR